MDLLNKLFEYLLETIISILKFVSRNQRERDSRIIEYINECIKNFEIIVNHDQHTQSESDIAHTWLKHAHYDLLKSLGELLTAKELDILRQSIMSGRIFYHAIRYGKVTEDQIINDYKGRFRRYVDNIYNQRDFRQNSNEIILRDIIKDGKPIPEDARSYFLSSIKEVCTEDLGRLYSFKELIKTRQVLIFSPRRSD